MIKGYKVLKKDKDGKLFCQPNREIKFYYEVGKDYYINKKQPIVLAQCGFHFFETFFRLLQSISYNSEYVFAEVVSKSDNKDIQTRTGYYATRHIRIKKILSEDDIMKIIKKETGLDEFKINSSAIRDSDKMFDSHAIHSSKYITRSSAVYDSENITHGMAVKCCKQAVSSEAIYLSNKILDSQAINDSEAVSSSYAVYNSGSINDSYAIHNSHSIEHCCAVRSSWLVIDSHTIDNSYVIRGCNALFNCLFCHAISGKSFYLFNKKTTQKRFEEIATKLHALIWYPSTNSLIRDNIINYDRNINIFKNMPNKFIKYVKSLKEYDQEIFNKITKEYRGR